MLACVARRWSTYLFVALGLTGLTPLSCAQQARPQTPLTWYVPETARLPVEPHRTLVGYSSWAELADKLATDPQQPYHLTLLPRQQSTADWRVLRTIRPATSLTVQLNDSTSADSLMPILAQWPTLRTLRISGETRPHSMTVVTDPKTGASTIKSTRTDWPLPRAGWDKLLAMNDVTLGDGLRLDSGVRALQALPGLETLTLEAFVSEQTALVPSLSRLRQLRHLTIRWTAGLIDYDALLSELTNLETLTIHAFDLAKLNAGLRHLSRLKTLDVSCTWKEASMATLRLGHLPQLQTLCLRSGPIQPSKPVALDSTLLGLTTLRHLVLEHVPIASFPPSLLANRQLTTLSIHDAQLTTLPDQMDQLAELTELSLDRNPLRHVPPSICRLSGLHQLGLSHCELETLPQTIGQLRSLTHLSLSTNQLTAVPASIGQLAQLRQLNLTMNQLTTLPASVGQLPQLETLVVVWNQLTELPGGFARLLHLYAADNQLTDLPLAPSSWRRLRSLTLNSNPIRYLPDAIGQLDSLETLTLGDNQLTELPASLGNLRRLRELTIGPNQLRELPATIGNLTALTAVSITSNPIETLPPSVGAWRQLRVAKLDLPKLRQVPEQIGQWHNVEDLTIESDNLLVLPNELTDCRSLTTLLVGGGRLMGLPERIGQLARLTELILRGRVDSTSGRAVGAMVALPGSLADCQALTDLTVQHQPQLDGTEALQLTTRLPLLNRLILQDCGLTDLGHVAWADLRATYLNLSQNRLSELPAALLRMPRLREVDFSSNNLPAHLNRAFRGMVQLVEAIRQ